MQLASQTGTVLKLCCSVDCTNLICCNHTDTCVFIHHPSISVQPADSCKKAKNISIRPYESCLSTTRDHSTLDNAFIMLDNAHLNNTHILISMQNSDYSLFQSLEVPLKYGSRLSQGKKSHPSYLSIVFLSLMIVWPPHSFTTSTGESPCSAELKQCSCTELICALV